MRKTQVDALNRLNQYRQYAKAVDVHQSPVSGVHSGAHGISYEMAVRYALGNYRSKRNAAAAGRVDTTKRVEGVLAAIEIKSGCGELATLDANGNILRTVFTRDYVVYAPEYTPEADVLKVSYVLTADDFMTALTEARAIRFKKSTNMTKRPKEEQYSDRLAIQTFSNSRKATDRMYDALETYGVRLDKWMEQVGL